VQDDYIAIPVIFERVYLSGPRLFYWNRHLINTMPIDHPMGKATSGCVSALPPDGCLNPSPSSRVPDKAITRPSAFSCATSRSVPTVACIIGLHRSVTISANKKHALRLNSRPDHNRLQDGPSPLPFLNPGFQAQDQPAARRLKKKGASRNMPRTGKVAVAAAGRD